MAAPPQSLLVADHWAGRAVHRAGLVDEIPLETLPPTATPAEVWELVRDAIHSDDATMAEAVAEFFRTPVADLRRAQPTAVQLLPPSVARKYLVFPLADLDRRLLVATCNPADLEAEREIGFASGRRPEFVVAAPSELRRAIDLAYEPDRAVEDVLERLGDMDRVSLEVLEEAETIAESDEADLESGPAVKLANLILHDAISQGASDIHIQPTIAGGVVRIRVDGVLRTSLQFPLPVLNRVVSRVKVVGKMNIADRLRPQDGRAHILNQGRRYDLRISTVPVRGSEKAVIRILDPASVGTLEETRLPERDLDTLRNLLRHRDGIVVVCGPTGSGKTTTLYGALAEIATDEVNIMTVEDPVEYELPGLAQIQVEPRKGVTFASALRAILRQDPDVIFVGEIRDAETAEMAAQASLTGHLVLATVHANDAVGAIRRLTDIGLDVGTVGQTLRGSLAQRLVRRVCPDCAEPIAGELTDEEAALAERYGVPPRVRAVGCESCHQHGYRGRIPVAEILQLSPAVEALVLAAASPQKVEAQARSEGMRTLLEAGLERVVTGETTLHEVQRVLGGEVGEETLGDAGNAAVESPVAVESDEPEGPPRVLLVDDDPVTRAVARALLERDGFEVREAGDGREAIAILTRDPDFSLTVLDLEMPHLGGEGVLRELRAMPATAALPAIVLTGRTEAALEAELLRSGADDYLGKPIDPVRFGARIHATLRRARG